MERTYGRSGKFFISWSALAKKSIRAGTSRNKAAVRTGEPCHTYDGLVQTVRTVGRRLEMEIRGNKSDLQCLDFGDLELSRSAFHSPIQCMPPLILAV